MYLKSNVCVVRKGSKLFFLFKYIYTVIPVLFVERTFLYPLISLGFLSKTESPYMWGGLFFNTPFCSINLFVHSYLKTTLS